MLFRKETYTERDLRVMALEAATSCAERAAPHSDGASVLKRARSYLAFLNGAENVERPKAGAGKPRPGKT